MIRQGIGAGPGGPSPAAFSLRIAVLGALALALFAVIFLRLWYLEILSGDRYLAEAQNNQMREFRVEAPRGKILDRDGQVLVENRASLAVLVRPTELPADEGRRERVLEHLAGATGVPLDRVRREIRRQQRELPASPVTIKRDVPYEVVYYLTEHQAQLPGVSVDRIYVRSYPQGELAAHLFGNVGEITEGQLEDPLFEGLVPGDRVGQTGIEQTYDHVLRGVPGATRVTVDALGQPTGAGTEVQEPEVGNDLQLALDLEVQQAGETALARTEGPGAFAALDVETGEVIALGSKPTFDPTIFTRPSLPQSTYNALTSPELDNPLANRAIQGEYPAGSTWKVITAVAALEDGVLTPTEILHDGGTFQLDEHNAIENAGGAAYGAIDMRRALQVSSNVYFAQIGARTNTTDDEGGPIQRWARRLGLAGPTGIDLPAETNGRIPTPGWRNEWFDEGLTDRPWSIGDNVNLSLGQGDLGVNPLQMAIAYAAVANGGEVVRPRLGLLVKDPLGRAVEETHAEVERELEISESSRAAILDGIRDAAMAPGGTSYGTFGGWPIEVAGKTGTAERGFDRPDQSWYVAVAPYDDPQVAVAVTLERGGFGGETAAPAAADILAAHFGIRPGQVDSVSGAQALD